MVTIHPGDCRDVLANMPAASVQCVVTSPPYYGLRDYGVAAQIGLEPSPDEYLATMVAVFRQVRRVLRDDGTCWVNMGDSYANTGNTSQTDFSASQIGYGGRGRGVLGGQPAKKIPNGLKPKDLLMMPARLALALQADGWWLRSDIIWHKPNPMPESVTDRPTSAHEHVFLLTKHATYYYDADAVREPHDEPGRLQVNSGARFRSSMVKTFCAGDERGYNPAGRNLRNVWTIATAPYAEAHFATFPPALAERCIKAGSRMGDTVLDPFAGAGTTLLVADRLQRNAIGIELKPAYTEMAMARCVADAPLFTSWPPAEDPADARMADLFAGHGE